MITAKTLKIGGDETGTTTNKSLSSSLLLRGDNDEMTRQRKYIIPHNHWFIKSWDYFIITLALYNSLTLPVQLSFPSFECYFEYECKANGKMGPMWVFDTSVDVFFFADIIIKFMTTYMDTRLGDEIYQPGKICIHYLKGSFIFDFISVLPPFCSPFLKNHRQVYSVVRTLSIFKLVRVIRISRLIETMNASLSNKTYTKMVLIFYWILLIFHIMACLLKLLFFSEKKWVPAFDFGYPGRDAEKTNLYYACPTES